jgi:hypothetical protein
MLFTYVFGVYSAFIFVKSQSFISSFILHIYCNYLGVPRLGECFEKEKI